MGSIEVSREQLLKQARELVDHLENDRQDEAGFVIEMFALQRETALFNEVGRFTRELHNALQQFSVDTRLVQITEQEIPDAKQRLQHVIDTTEQAAHRTLTAIEECGPVADSMSEGIARMRGLVGNAEQGDWQQELSGLLESNETQLQDIKARLSEILMTQEFQDVTGQVLQQVIELVTRLENNLVQMLAVAGERILQQDGDEQRAAKKGGAEAAGPAVPGVDKDDRVSSQDEVDDLLSSLGF
jgi:chemotaxis protein CheZ